MKVESWSEDTTDVIAVVPRITVLLLVSLRSLPFSVAIMIPAMVVAYAIIYT